MCKMQFTLHERNILLRCMNLHHVKHSQGRDRQKKFLHKLEIEGGLLAKSEKLIFQGRAFLEGKIQKNDKIFLKIFIVLRRPLGYIGNLYTYRGYILVSCKTPKNHKNSHFGSKWVFLSFFGIFM